MIVTRGRDGALAVAGDMCVDVPSETVEVVDTVGAGDAFNAGLLFELERRGALGREPGEEDLRAALGFGAKVAAATCGRVGADPPRLAALA